MDIADIWQLSYRKLILESGQYFFAVYNERVYTIIGSPPYAVISDKWHFLNGMTKSTYKLNQNLIDNQKWSSLDITAHNMLHLMAYDFLKIHGKQISPNLKANINIIINLRNNIAHSNIVKIRDIRKGKRKCHSELPIDPTFLKEEFNELDNLYVDIFKDLNGYFRSHGKPSTEKEVLHIRSMISIFTKSIEVPNLLETNIASIENTTERQILDLGNVEPEVKESDEGLHKKYQHLEETVEKMKGQMEILIQNAAAQQSSSKHKGDVCYPNVKGRIYVFNYFKFDIDHPDVDNREGAEEDNVKIEETFGTFQGKYELIFCNNYTVQETFSKFEELQQDLSLKDMDSIIIFISSHGESKHVFYTRDGKMNLNKLRKMLHETSDGCIFLKDKPKIILANYCQGDDDEMEITESKSRRKETAVRETRKSVPRNMKTYYSTSKGCPAWRYDGGGAYSIHFFCKTLKATPDLELQRLIYKTNQEVEAELGHRNTFSEEGSSFDHFYF